MSDVMGRVLIADDDPGVRDLLVARLEIAGYQTVIARDGREAMTRIKATKPDAMILDIGMPKMDGFDVLRALQVEKPKGDLPVMVLTARGQPSDVKAAIALGAKDYLAKPFNSITLLSRIERLIKARRPAVAPAPDDEDEDDSFFL